jgi:hypothetical protein
MYNEKRGPGGGKTCPGVILQLSTVVRMACEGVERSELSPLRGSQTYRSFGDEKLSLQGHEAWDKATKCWARATFRSTCAVRQQVLQVDDRLTTDTAAVLTGGKQLLE